MSSWATRVGGAVLCASGCVLLALPACSSDAAPGSSSSAGNTAIAGASGMVSAAGASGAVSMAGSSGAVGVAGAAAGAGTGGASAGAGGAASGGTSGSAAGGSSGAGTAGAAGSGGAGGTTGGGNCAKNAISLSANGTGTASDAAHSRVSIDMMTDLPIGNAHRTVEFWAYIKPTDWMGEKNEVYVYGSPMTANTTNTAFGLDFGTNTVMGMANNHATLNPYTNGSFTVDSTADLGVTSAAAQWLHVAMSWDGMSFKTYVNGELKITKTDAATMLATASTPLTMGCNPPILNCFNGLFDELRVWNVDRSAADIKANYGKSLVGNEAGLVGYWKFDEAPGAASAADSVTPTAHPAHSGQLMAEMAAQKPTFVTPNPPAPITCP